MRLVRYELDWRSHWGLLQGDVVHELVGDPYDDCQAGQPVGPFASLKLLAPCNGPLGPAASKPAPTAPIRPLASAAARS